MIAVLASLALTPAAHAANDATTVSDPASLVDPFAGTGSGGDVVGQVDTFPGADVPFGMMQWSPDTPSRPAGGGYNISDSAITGFSLTHVSGPGCAIAGDFPFLPVTGAVPADPASASASFAHSSESARPGSYAVTAGGVRTELATTARSGVARFTYPATDQARMLVKVANSAAGGAAASFRTVGDREITGSVTSGHFCGQPNTYTVHFAARFDRPFTASGTWGGQSPAAPQVTAGSTRVAVTAKQGAPAKAQSSRRSSERLSGRQNGAKQAEAAANSGVVAGGYLTFDTRKNPVLGMRVAVSYVSVQGAEANLRAEAKTWNVAKVAADAKAGWNRQLRAISIGGGTRTQQSTFYTALYHALLHPNLFSDADGRYIGFDGKVHRVAAGHAQYSTFSGWDIYRSQVPLLAMIAPQQTSDMATSLLNDADQGGWLPKWPVANGYTGVMNGDPADAILADAYAFGARGFDTRHALKTMVHGAEAGGAPGQGWYAERPHGADYIHNGYVPNVGSDDISPVPNGASETLEYALADFSVYRMATALGRPDIATRFHSRSQNWANLFDTATGYIRPRDADGAFPPGPPVQTTGGFGQNGFQEGNAAQYTWMVPQDLPGLIHGMGGDKAANARLDDYFTQLNAGPNAPYHWQGNEPVFGTPWVYNSTGRPWKTQATVRRIMDTLYVPGPGGEPGNDDLGAMSSWYVWAALGIYPQTPGAPMFVVGSPLFPHAVVHGRGGHNLTINASGAGDTYVQSLRVNGRASSHTWVDLGATDRLDFTLGSSPDTRWGTAPSDAPPSYPAGRTVFPPTTRAALSADPGQIRIAPGGSAKVDVKIDNSAGSTPATVTWQADAPAGLTATPAGQTVTAQAGASVSSSVSVSAASGVATGYYRVALTGHAVGGAILARTDVLVTVAEPGQFIPTAYVSNYSDNTVTPVDTRTRNAGPPIAVGSGPDGMTATAGHLFVANNNSNDVTVVDLTTNAVTTTIKVGGVAADVAPTPDAKTVWVSNFGDGTVQPIDTATLTAGAPVKVGNQPERLRVRPGGRELWVVNQGDGTVSVVDLASRTVTRTIAVGAAPFGIAFAPDGSRAYVTNNGAGTVSVIDTGNYQVLSTVATGAGPEYVAVTPDGKTAYVATNGANGVTPLDTATLKSGATIPTGGGAYGVALSPDGKTAWVVDTNVNDVRPVDTATGTAGAAIKVDNVPDGVAVTG